MDIDLEPTPKNAPAIADWLVGEALQATGRTLDYSLPSIAFVDQILQEFHAKKFDPIEIRMLLFGFGVYIGEVMRRNSGGEWVDGETAVIPEELKSPIVFLINGCYANPYQRAMKRVALGPEESIVDYVAFLTGPEVPQSSEKRDRKGGRLGKLFGRRG